jgi:hypothetical protein
LLSDCCPGLGFWFSSMILNTCSFSIQSI